MRSVARRSQEAERQHALRVHRLEGREHELLVHSRLAQVAQVAEQSERAQLVLGHEASPRLSLRDAVIGTCRRKGDLPGVGHGEPSPDQLLPHAGLLVVTRLGVRQEQDVAQLDGAAAIVLRELVLVELRKRGREALLDLARERHAAVLPVDGYELAQLVSALNDALEGLGHQTAMGLVTSHLAHQEQRRVTELHLLTRLDGKHSHSLGLDLGNKLGNAAGDLNAVLIKLALPEQAGEHRAAQLQLVRDVTRGGSLVGAKSAGTIHQIESGHF